jgi:hypothetical protein
MVFHPCFSLNQSSYRKNGRKKGDFFCCIMVSDSFSAFYKFDLIETRNFSNGFGFKLGVNSNLPVFPKPHFFT